MTKAEEEKLLKGLRQSSSNPNSYTNGNGDWLKRISDERTQINGKTVYGSTAAEREKKKW